jgi:hypothetical protein
MKRLIVGVLALALMLLGPVAEAGAERSAKQGKKPHAAKVGKAGKAKPGKSRQAKAKATQGKRVAKAGKTKKYAQVNQAKRYAQAKHGKQAKQGKAGRKLVSTKKGRTMARSSAARHAGASSRVAQYAAAPVEVARTNALRLDYGDALTDGELELRSAAAAGGRSENRRGAVRKKTPTPARRSLRSPN